MTCIFQQFPKGVPSQPAPPGGGGGSAGPWATADWFVSPTGSNLNSGSALSPWSLTYALSGAGGQVHPGDVIEMAGGTYSGNFSNSLIGTVTNPIIVRAAWRSRAKIDGTVISNPSTSAYTWFWGIEIMRSVIDANIIGLNSFGQGNRIIHCIIHDHPSNGMTMWAEGPDQVAYGNIIYNNGYSGQTPDHSAHGIYTQNQTGTKRVATNIIFGNYGYGIHMYGSEAAHVDFFTTEDNILANNGVGKNVAMTGGLNYLIENGNPIQSLIFRRNLCYYTAGFQDTAGKCGSIFDDSIVNNGGIFEDNYIFGLAMMGYWSNLSVQRNLVLMREGYIAMFKYLYTNQPPVGGVWDNNSYIDTQNTTTFTRLNALGVIGSSNFAGWKTAMGVDANSSFSQTLPAVNKVVIQPSEFEVGRANIAVYNWQGLSSISIDPSSVLSSGDQYDVVNAQNFFGAPVASGTYTGSPIAIPIAAVTPPPSVSTKAVMPSTGTEFAAFVLRKVNF